MSGKRGELYRNPQGGKIAGVCAGIAKHYDLPRLAVRIAAIGALIMLPVATGVAYVVASVLLPERSYG